MKNLLRALRMAFKYRWSLIASFLCSIMVAILWGANLGAVYPFVEVIFNKKHSLHQWIDEKIEKEAQNAQAASAKADELEGKIANAKSGEANSLRDEARHHRMLAKAESEKAAKSRMLRPYIKKYLPADPFRTLLTIVFFLIGGTVLRGLFLMANMVLVARVSQRTVLDLQNSVFRRTLQMELNAPGTKGTGDLVGRIRGETGAIGQAISTLFGKTTREPLKMAVCLGGAAYINWRLLVFSLLVCPIAVYLMLLLARSTKRANKRAVEESAKLNNRLFQALTYIKVVKAFTMESHERMRFRKISKDVYRKGMRISIYTSLARINNELLATSILCLSFLAGGYLVLNGATHMMGVRLCNSPMGFGEMMTFFAFLVGVSDPIRKLADVYSNMQGGLVAADRIFPLIDRRPAIAKPAEPLTMPVRDIELTFENVSFSYQSDLPVLNHVSATIGRNESIAIVGPNGCGKSTLINMVPRFFDPAEGRILLNGHDLRDYRPKDVRRQIGYVTQQTMLFDDSIINNIRYGNLNSSRDDVIEAAKRAHAHSFIMSKLEQGYDSTIGEHGGRLSGGQRQRLALARAILKDPPILILDEATSQIDPESELLIHNTLAEFIKDRTSIIVTHRMSTLALVDKVMVMDSGNIVDFGTHDELMRRCSTYQRLHQSELRESA